MDKSHNHLEVLEKQDTGGTEMLKKEKKVFSVWVAARRSSGYFRDRLMPRPFPSLLAINEEWSLVSLSQMLSSISYNESFLLTWRKDLQLTNDLPNFYQKE